MLARGPSRVAGARGPRSRTGSIAPQGFRRTNGAQDAVRRDSVGRGVMYVRSTTGYDGNSGGTWKSAKASAYGASLAVLAGDTVYFSQVHAESGNLPNIVWPATDALPNYMLCANDNAEPPTSLATTGSITASAGGNLSPNSGGANLYWYGITFTMQVGQNFNFVQAAANKVIFESCSFIINTGSTTVLAGTSASANDVLWLNCTIKFASQPTSLTFGTGKLVIRGGSFLAGTLGPSTALVTNFLGTTVVFEGFDLSNLPSNFTMGNSAFGASSFILRNCKMPAGWSGTMNAGTYAARSGTVSLHNTDGANTNYYLWQDGYPGSVRHETTVVRSGGASDGTTALSWKMAANTKALYPTTPLYSPERAQWNELTGSAKTLTVEVVHDSQGSGTAGRLTDAECWLEVIYLSDSATPLGAWIADVKANVLATAADQPDSAASWTTTGLTTPLKQALSVTVTPQKKGHFLCRVAFAAPGKTVYVDPLLTVT